MTNVELYEMAKASTPPEYRYSIHDLRH
jgi:hypothetical protein